MIEPYVDYILETSNDEKMPFLEAIEAISRSHRDNSSAYELLTYPYPTIADYSDFSNNSRSKPDFISSIVKTEPDDSSCPNPWDPSVLALDENDKLNMTDCDLNLLVDPRTGVPVYDGDESDESESSEIPDPEMTDTMENVGGNVYSIAEHSVQTFADVKFQCIPEKMEEAPVVEQPPELSTIQNNNRLVLIQIASPTSNSTVPMAKERKAMVQNGGQAQLKSLLVQDERFDKPPFSYSCLIAMALKNSETGFLPVSEIYSYIVDKFPYFKTAPDGWKNSIRHNLSLNKCFQKLETPSMNGTTRKACLWGLNEAKVSRLDEEIAKWLKRTASDTRQDAFSQVTEKLDWEENNKETDSVILTDDFQTSIAAASGGISWVSQRSGSSGTGSGATIGRLVEQNDIRLFRLVKVASSNNHQEQPLVPSEPVVKQEQLVVKQEPLVVKQEQLMVKPVVVLPDEFRVLTQPTRSPGDPFFAGFGAQNGLWDDLTETNELRAAAASFVVGQSSQTNQHSACRLRLANDSPITLKTVRASA